METGPNAGVFKGRGVGGDRPELFAVAEGTTPAGEAFAAHVISALGKQWATLDLSLTGALKAVVAEAERAVGDWNNRSISQHQVSLGLTCFAHRGDQAVFAQLGPGIAFHTSQLGTRTIVADDDYSIPLGLHREQAGPAFTRVNLAPGDRILVLSTPALSEIEESLLAEILLLPADQVLAEIYQRVRGLRSVSALLVVANGAPELSPHGTAPVIGTPESDAAPAAASTTIEAPVIGAPPEPQRPPQAPDNRPLREALLQPKLFVDGGEEEDTLARARGELKAVRVERRKVDEPLRYPTMPMAPMQRAAGDSALSQRVTQQNASAAASRAIADAARESASGANQARARWNASGQAPSHTRPQAAGSRPGGANDASRPGRPGNSFSRGLVRESIPPPPPPSLSDVPLVSDLAADRRAQTARETSTPMTASGSLSEMIAADAPPPAEPVAVVKQRSNMGGRWRSRRGGGGRSIGGTNAPPTWVIVSIGLALIIGVLGFLVVPGMLDEDNGAREAELIGSAREQLSIADAQQDPGLRREALTAAQGMLLEAQEIDPADPTTANLLVDVTSALGVMDAVAEPAAVEGVASLAEFGEAPVAVDRLVVSDTEAYILDLSAGNIIATELATGDSRVAWDPATGLPAPVAIAYVSMSELGGGTLLVADAGGGLWSLRPLAEPQPLEFAAPDGLGVTDLAGLGEELYVLDSAGAAILRFHAAAGGFGTAPVVALETPDLAEARRLMVDSEFITVDASGAIHRFSGEIAFLLGQAGIDRPLVSAEAPQAMGESGEIALADPAGDRIVVFARDGAFARQYRHPAFQGITALAMREGTGYVFASGILSRVTF